MPAVLAAASILSLADLEGFDVGANGTGRERRFCCPLCGEGKPKDAAHRSIGANIESGLWNCYRCRAAGKLSDFWQDRPKIGRRERAAGALQRAFASQVPQDAAVLETSVQNAKEPEWRAQLRQMQPLAGTSGAAYLQGRSVPLDMAHYCGVRFVANWYGRTAAMFPIRDRAGQLVAAQGRYLDGRDTPKARTGGDKKQGVFSTPGVWDAPAIIITEAPLDTLSLAACGFPALALCGTGGPVWLSKACAFRRVLLGFDADDAGDNAAASMAAVLSSYGAQTERLRPEGGKDWNELLQALGAGALADLIVPRVLLDAAARAQIEALPDDDIFGAD
jgi:hypothetical protein